MMRPQEPSSSSLIREGGAKVPHFEIVFLPCCNMARGMSRTHSGIMREAELGRAEIAGSSESASFEVRGVLKLSFGRDEVAGRTSSESWRVEITIFYFLCCAV